MPVAPLSGTTVFAGTDVRVTTEDAGAAVTPELELEAGAGFVEVAGVFVRHSYPANTMTARITTAITVTIIIFFFASMELLYH
jgi:hypothetical protein